MPASNFIMCFYQVLGHEGVYDNDPNDTGGETVFGVSRNNFPNWEGWAIVDRYKLQYSTSSSTFIDALNSDAKLSALKEQWYKTNFWDVFELDNLNDFSLAYEIFDQSVNLGVGRTTQFIQMACNALNYNYVFGSDLSVDNAIGPMTRRRLADIGNNPQYTDVLRKALDGLQTYHYVNLGKDQSGRSNYRKYMRGWLGSRVGKFGQQGQVK